MQGNRLRPIGEEIPAFFGAEAEQPQPTPQPPQQPSPSAQHAATSMLLLALRALSQRAIVAAGALFTLLTVASAWWLWMVTLSQPSAQQLVGLGLYGLLILALNYLVLTRRI
jgi:hypothetical protein